MILNQEVVDIRFSLDLNVKKMPLIGKFMWKHLLHEKQGILYPQVLIDSD